MKNVDDIDVEKVIDQVVKKRNFRKALKKSAEICEEKGLETGFVAFFNFKDRKLGVGKVVKGGCGSISLAGSNDPIGYSFDQEGVNFFLHFHPTVITDESLEDLLPSLQDIRNYLPPGSRWIIDAEFGEEEGVERIERDFEMRDIIEIERDCKKEWEQTPEIKDQFKDQKYIKAVAGVAKRKKSLTVVVLFYWEKEKPSWKEILENYPDESGVISFSDGIKILKNAFEVKIEKFRFLLKNTGKGGDAYEKRQKNTKKNPA